MINKTEIRVARQSDKDGILKLLNEVFSEQQKMNIQRGDAFWQWKFEENIFGNSILTVADCEGEIVGVDHLWPWEFQCRGEVIKAMQPCDSSLDPRFRGKGIFKKMRYFGLKKAVESNYQLFVNFPNKNSLPINRSIGSNYLGKVKWWVKVLKPARVLRGYIQGNKTGKIIDIDDEFSLNLELLGIITNESSNFDKYIKINRVEGFYRWRYVERPIRQYGMITCEKKGLKTAAIFTMNQSGINREMVIVDLIGSTKNLEPLFKLITKAARHLQSDFIAVMNNPEFSTQNLWKLGFMRKKLKNMVVLPADIGLESKVTTFSNWSLMAGMHDSI